MMKRTALIKGLLCQLVAEPPVSAVVRHHELLQLVEILPPLVCVEQLHKQGGKRALIRTEERDNLQPSGSGYLVKVYDNNNLGHCD